MCVCVCDSERERGRERDRETDTQTERERDRQTDRDGRWDGQTDKQPGTATHLFLKLSAELLVGGVCTGSLNTYCSTGTTCDNTGICSKCFTQLCSCCASILHSVSLCYIFKYMKPTGPIYAFHRCPILKVLLFKIQTYHIDTIRMVATAFVFLSCKYRLGPSLARLVIYRLAQCNKCTRSSTFP